MSDSLRDQLLGLGFKPAPKPERKPESRPEARGERHGGKRPDGARADGQRGHPPRGPRERGHGDHANAKPSSGERRPHGGKPGPSRPAGGPRRDERRSGEMDLAKAYAIRAQKEKDERIEAERLRQEEAARRREGKQKLIEFLKSASLNDPKAELARHFEYGGKIRRVYVTDEQFKAVNAGELAVVQQGGRYHVVTTAHAQEADALLPGALALLVDPNAPKSEEGYEDPRYQIPDDLVW